MALLRVARRRPVLAFSSVPAFSLVAAVLAQQTAVLAQQTKSRVGVSAADRLSRRQPLVPLAFAAAAGIGCDAWLAERLGDHSGSSLLAIEIVLALLAACFAWWHPQQAAPWRRAWPLVCVAAGFAAWHAVDARWYPRHDLRYLASDFGQPVVLEAEIVRPPRAQPPPRDETFRAFAAEPRTRALAIATRIRNGPDWQQASGKLVIWATGTPDTLTDEGALLAGDICQIRGQLALPQRAMNPGEFDYRAFAAADRVSAILTVDTGGIERLRRGAAWRPTALVERMRSWGRGALGRYLHTAQVPTAEAMLLGERDSLPSIESESFMLTGTLHLLVVSGLHLSILALTVGALGHFGVFSRRVSLLLVVCVVVGYAVIADARPPVLRATILSLLVCLGWFTGRKVIAYNSLAAAALVILAINPSDLFRVGPQLSFLAVATLIWYGQHWQAGQQSTVPDAEDQDSSAERSSLLRFAFRWMWQLSAATAVIWLTALPLVLWHFHVIAPVAILLTPFVWLLAASSLVSGFAMLLLLAAGEVVAGTLPAGASLVSVPAGVFGAVADHSLWLLQQVVLLAEQVPVGHWFWPRPPAGWLLLFYGLLLATVLRPRLAGSFRWSVGTLVVLAALGICLATIRRDVTRWWDGEQTRVTALAMGHGTSVVLELPDGSVMLYDAGRLGSATRGSESISSFLWHRGIRNIDRVYLSHADLDHYNALPGLLSRFSIEEVVTTPHMFSPAATGPVVALRKVLAEQRVPIRLATRGHVERREGVELRVLHPPKGFTSGEDNASSLVVRVSILGKRMLLTGDMEGPPLARLIVAGEAKTDVLLAPHHGSRASMPRALAKASGCETVIISGRESPQIDQTAAEFAAHGAQVLRTARHGAVTWALYGGDGVHAWLTTHHD